MENNNIKILLIALMVASIGCSQKRTVTVTWDGSESATSYLVYVNSNTTVTTEVVANEATLSLSNIPTTVWVVARNQYGDSSPSEPLLIPRVGN